jgi:indolepyruvate decarboxylase
VVIVLDNQGYGTERLLQPEEHAYNNIRLWRYSKLPELLGGGVGYEVATEGEFDAALRTALADRNRMSLIQVHLNPNDRSEALQRLADRLGPRV